MQSHKPMQHVFTSNATKWDKAVKNDLTEYLYIFWFSEQQEVRVIQITDKECNSQYAEVLIKL